MPIRRKKTRGTNVIKNEAVREMFPDFDQIEKGEWSSHNTTVMCDDGEMEIALFRKNDGTYRLRIYEDRILISEKRVS